MEGVSVGDKDLVPKDMEQHTEIVAEIRPGQIACQLYHMYTEETGVTEIGRNGCSLAHSACESCHSESDVAAIILHFLSSHASVNVVPSIP